MYSTLLDVFIEFYFLDIEVVLGVHILGRDMCCSDSVLGIAREIWHIVQWGGGKRGCW